MEEIKLKITEIIRLNNNALFPTQTPEEIAELIIDLFKELEFTPPSNQNCIDYILKKELLENKTVNQVVDTADLFVNYYSSVGWVVGKTKKPMKSWKKALNNWCKRDWTKKSNAKAKIEESIKAYLLIQKTKRNG